MAAALPAGVAGGVGALAPAQAPPVRDVHPGREREGRREGHLPVFPEAVLSGSGAERQGPGLPAVPRAQRHALHRRREEPRRLPARDLGLHVRPHAAQDVPVGAGVQRLGERAVVGQPHQRRARQPHPAAHGDPVPLPQRGGGVGPDPQEPFAAPPPQLVDGAGADRVSVEAGRHAVGQRHRQRVDGPPQPAREGASPAAVPSHPGRVQGKPGRHVPLRSGVAQQGQRGVGGRRGRRARGGRAAPRQLRVALGEVEGGHLHRGSGPIGQAGLVGEAGGEAPVHLPSQVHAPQPQPLPCEEAPHLRVAGEARRVEEVPAAGQARLGRQGLQGAQADPGERRQEPPGHVPGLRRTVGESPHDPVEAGRAQVALQVLAVNRDALGRPAESRAGDSVFDGHRKQRPQRRADPSRKQREVAPSRGRRPAREEIGASAVALRRDRLLGGALHPGPQVEAVQRRFPEPAFAGAPPSQREVDPCQAEARRPQPLQPVGPHVAPVQEERRLCLPLVADRQRRLQAPGLRGEASQPQRRPQLEGPLVAKGRPRAQLSEEAAAPPVRRPRAEEVTALDFGVEGGHQPPVPEPPAQPQLVDPHLAGDRRARLVGDAHRDLPHRRQVGRPSSVLQDHGVGRVRGPEDQGRVRGRPGLQRQRFLGLLPQTQPAVEVDHHFRPPVLLAHPPALGRPIQARAEEVEVAVVGPRLDEEPRLGVDPEVPPGHRPEPGLAVGEEVAGPLGEAVVDLDPVARLHILEGDRQRPLVELDSLSAERCRRVVQLLHDPRRRHVVVAPRELRHRSHLDAPRGRRRVAPQAPQRPRRPPLDPGRAHDPHPGQHEGVAPPARHREAQVANRPQLGLGDRAAHVQPRRVAQRDPVEAEAGPRLVAVPSQEARRSVQRDHEAPVPLQHVQVAVLVQVLGVGAAVAPRAVGVPVAQGVHPAPLGEAVLVPHAPAVGLVPPYLAPSGVGLLVEEPQAPGDAGAGLRPGHRPRGVGEEGVFADDPHVQHQLQEVAVADVELDEVGLGEVRPGRTQHRGDRRPRPGPLLVAALGLEADEEPGFPHRAAPDPDLLVDVRRRVEAFEDAQAVAARRLLDPGVLPGEVGQVGLGGIGRQGVLGAVQVGRPAPAPPVVVPDRERAGVEGVEVVQVRLSLGVGVGQRDGRFGREANGRASARVQPGNRVQKAGQEGRVERQVGIEASQAHGARLDSHLRAAHQPALGLVEARQVHGPVAPQVVAGVQAEHRGGGYLEEAPLLPRHVQDSPRVRGQEALRVQQHQLPHVVVDGVVHVAHQRHVAQQRPLRPLSDAHGSQGERGHRPRPPHLVGEVEPEDAAVLPLEGVRVAVDALVAVGAQDAPGFGGPQREASDGRGVGEGLERGEDHEGARHRGQVLEGVLGRPVDVGLVQPVGGRLLVHAEEAQPGDVVSVGPAGEGSSCALLPQRDHELDGARVHVVGRRDPVDLVHLGAPRGPAGLMLGRRRLEQLQRGPTASPVRPLRVVGAHRVARRRHVGDRQHLGRGQGRAEDHPQAARVHDVVLARLEVPEPCRLGHSVLALPRRGVGLDVALDLLAREEAGLGTVELDRVRAGSDGGGRVRRDQREHVHVRVPEERFRVEEEEELALHVVRVVEDEGVRAGEAAARALQPEAPGGDLAGLLRPHPLHVHRPRFYRRLEAEVAGGNALAQEAGRRQGEAHVAHLEALEELAGLPPVADVDAIGSGELAGLVVVHIHDHPVGHGAVGDGGELHVGADSGKEREFAGDLDRLVAGAVLGPVAPELARAPEREPQVHVLVAYAGDCWSARRPARAGPPCRAGASVGRGRPRQPGGPWGFRGPGGQEPGQASRVDRASEDAQAQARPPFPPGHRDTGKPQDHEGNRGRRRVQEGAGRRPKLGQEPKNGVGNGGRRFGRGRAGLASCPHLAGRPRLASNPGAPPRRRIGGRDDQDEGRRHQQHRKRHARAVGTGGGVVRPPQPSSLECVMPERPRRPTGSRYISPTEDASRAPDDTAAQDDDSAMKTTARQ